MNIVEVFQQESQTPEFQAMDDVEREQLREGLFWNDLAPRLDPNEVESVKAEYDAITAPKGDPYAGVGEDIARSFGGGIVAPVGDIARFFTGGAPNLVSSEIEQFNKELLEGRSPTAIQAEQATGLEMGPEGLQFKEGSSLYGGLMQLSGAGGSMVSSIGTGFGMGKAVGLAGKVLAGTQKATDAAIKANNLTRARELVARTMAQEQTAQRIGYGLTGATMVGGGTGKQAYDETLEKTGSVALAEQAGRDATVMGAGLGAATMGLAGPIEQRLLSGGAANRLIGMGKGALTEGVQEFAESGGQEYLAGKAMRDMGLDVGDLEGRSIAVGAWGALLGGVSGGVMGAVGKPQKPPTLEDIEGRIAVNNLEAGDLEGKINDPNTTDEQKAEYAKKLQDVYRAVAIDEIAKAGLQPQASPAAPQQPQAGQPQATPAVQPAEPGERRIATEAPHDWLPANMAERYQDSITKRRQIISQLRRAAQNGVPARQLRQFEDRIRAQDELINANRIALENAGGQKYFANSRDWFGWLQRASRGEQWEQLAKLELQARMGKPVDWPAMKQLETNILQQGDIRDRGRIFEINEVIKAVEQRMTRMRSTPEQIQKDRDIALWQGERQRVNRQIKTNQRAKRVPGQGLQPGQSSLTPEQQHLRSIEKRWKRGRWERKQATKQQAIAEEKAALGRIGQKAKTAKPVQKRTPQPDSAQAKTQPPVSGVQAAIQGPPKPIKPASQPKPPDSGPERLQAERDWRTPTVIRGKYTVKAANNLYFVVTGLETSHAYDRSLKALGGDRHPKTGKWVFPRNKRPVVETFLREQTVGATTARPLKPIQPPAQPTPNPPAKPTRNLSPSEQAWNTPTLIHGRYTLKAASAHYVSLSGVKKNSHFDKALQKLDGRYNADAGLWTFPRAHRAAVEELLRGKGKKKPTAKPGAVYGVAGAARPQRESTLPTETELVAKRVAHLEQTPVSGSGVQHGQQTLTKPRIQKLVNNLKTVAGLQVKPVYADNDSFYFVTRADGQPYTPYQVKKADIPRAMALLERDGKITDRNPITHYTPYQLRTTGPTFITEQDRIAKQIDQAMQAAMKEPEKATDSQSVASSPTLTEQQVVSGFAKAAKSAFDSGKPKWPPYPESEATHLYSPKGGKRQLVKKLDPSLAGMDGWYVRPDGSEVFLAGVRRYELHSLAELEAEKRKQKEAARKAEEDERKAKEKEAREEARGIKEAEKRRATRIKNEGLTDDTLNSKLPVPGLGMSFDTHSGLRREKIDGMIKLVDRNGKPLTDKELTSFMDAWTENGPHEYIPEKTKDEARISGKNLAYVPTIWGRDGNAFGEQKKAEAALKRAGLQATHYVTEGGGGYYIKRKPDLSDLTFEKSEILRNGAFETILIPQNITSEQAQAIRAITGEKVEKWSGRYDNLLHTARIIEKGTPTIRLRRHSHENFLKKLNLQPNVKTESPPVPKPSESMHNGFYDMMLLTNDAAMARRLLEFRNEKQALTEESINQFIADKEIQDGDAFRQYVKQVFGTSEVTPDTAEPKKKPSLDIMDILEGRQNVTGNMWSAIAKLLNTTQSRSGEKVSQQAERIRKHYAFYKSLTNATKDDLLDNNTMDALRTLYENTGSNAPRHLNKENLAEALLKWRDDIAKNITREGKKVILRAKVREQVENKQPVSTEDVIALSGGDGWIYTTGDLQVAQMLGRDTIPHPDDRGKDAPLYTLAENIIKGDMAWNESQLSAEDKAKVEELRNTTVDIPDTFGYFYNHEVVAKALGAGQYAKDFGEKFALELNTLIKKGHEATTETPSTQTLPEPESTLQQGTEPTSTEVELNRSQQIAIGKAGRIAHEAYWQNDRAKILDAYTLLLNKDVPLFFYTSLGTMGNYLAVTRRGVSAKGRSLVMGVGSVHDKGRKSYVMADEKSGIILSHGYKDIIEKNWSVFLADNQYPALDSKIKEQPDRSQKSLQQLFEENPAVANSDRIINPTPQPKPELTEATKKRIRNLVPGYKGYDTVSPVIIPGLDGEGQADAVIAHLLANGYEEVNYGHDEILKRRKEGFHKTQGPVQQVLRRKDGLHVGVIREPDGTVIFERAEGIKEPESETTPAAVGPFTFEDSGDNAFLVRGPTRDYTDLIQNARKAISRNTMELVGQYVKKHDAWKFSKSQQAAFAQALQKEWDNRPEDIEEDYEEESGPTPEEQRAERLQDFLKGKSVPKGWTLEPSDDYSYWIDADPEDDNNQLAYLLIADENDNVFHVLHGGGTEVAEDITSWDQVINAIRDDIRKEQEREAEFEASRKKTAPPKTRAQLTAGDRVMTKHDGPGTVSKVGRKYVTVALDGGMQNKYIIDAVTPVAQGDRAGELELFYKQVDDLIRKSLEHPGNYHGDIGDVTKFIKQRIFSGYGNVSLNRPDQIKNLLKDEGVGEKGWLKTRIEQLKQEVTPPAKPESTFDPKQFSNATEPETTEQAPEPTPKPQEETLPAPRRKSSRRNTSKVVVEETPEISKAFDDLAKALDGLLPRNEDTGLKSQGTVQADPAVIAAFLQHGTLAGSALVRSGAAKFKDWANNVLTFMEGRGFNPQHIAPYLKRLYAATQQEESLGDLADAMDDPKTVRNFDISTLLQASHYTVDNLDPALVKEALDAGRAAVKDTFMWDTKTSGKSAAKVPIIDTLFSKGPEDMSQSDIDDIATVLRDRLLAEERIYKMATDNKGPHWKDFVAKFLKNTDPQNSLLALDKHIKDTAQELRTLHREEGNEQALEDYKMWVKGELDKDLLKQRVMEYRDTWRKDNLGAQDNAGNDNRPGDTGRGQPETGQETGTGKPSGKTTGSVSTDNSGRPAGRGSSGTAGGKSGQSGSRSGRTTDVSDHGTGQTAGQGNSTGPDNRGDTAPVRGEDFRLTPDALAVDRTWKQKAADNLAAIRILKQLRAENRLARPDEQAALAKYVGWGASELANNMFPVPGRRIQDDWKGKADELADLLTPEEYKSAERSVNYAHFTGSPIINTMYNAVQKFGLKTGLAVEAGSGIGHFAGLIPPSLNLRYLGIERDAISAQIAKALYPNKGFIAGDLFKIGLPDNYADLVIGNPPYMNMEVKADPFYAKKGFQLHDYFIAKQIDALKPGGIGVFVVSSKTMDKEGQEARNYISEKAHLVGAIRLPNTAFHSAGTEVVTDILFFQRKGDDVQDPGNGFVATRENRDLDYEDAEGKPAYAKVNSYFLNHPDMVLGEQAMTSGRFGKEYTVHSPIKRSQNESKEAFQKRQDEWFEQALHEAIAKLPEGIVTSNPTLDEITARAAQYDINPMKKEDTFYIRDDGSIGQVKNAVGVTVPVRGGEVRSGLSKKQVQYVHDYIPLRDAVVAVYRAQTASDANWKKSVAAMEQAYDQFVKNNGPINQGTVTEVKRKDGKKYEVTKEPVVSTLQLDPEFYRVAAIEDFDIATGDAKKNRIFTERIVGQKPAPNIESALDAVAATLNKLGYLDMAEVQQFYDNKPMADIVEELGDQLYVDPATGHHVLRDNYLSGNVKAKLITAKDAAAKDPQYQRNVTELEKVIPEDLPASAIPMGLGSLWVPKEVIAKFAGEGMGIENPVINNVRHREMSTWTVTGQAETSEWATNRKTAMQILEAALNQQTLIITDTVIDPETNSKKQVRNDEETAAANAKKDELKKLFDRWVREDGESVDMLTKIYNRDFNTTVPTQHDGSHLTLPGLSDKYTLRPHQKNVVWRIVQHGNTYMAHAVGAGKTLASIVAGMEMKRMGLVNKPTYVVLKSTLKQFAAEYLDAYPNARILVADETQLDQKNRRRFMAKVASENWDAVIMTHESFTSIPMSDQYMQDFIDKQISELVDMLEDVDDDDMPTRKVLENQIESLEQKLEKRANDQAQGKDAGITFEDAGIDFLFVDEAHKHKRIGFPTRQSTAKGVDPTMSAIAFDLFMKTQYLDTLRPGRHTVLMSGTPVSNTMGELFNIQRYLQPQVLEANRISSFDSWTATFAESTTAIEFQPDGTFKPVTRMTRFVGVPGLMRDVLQVMDFVGMEQMREQGLVKLPQVQKEVVAAEQTEAMKDYQKELGQRIARYEALTGKQKREKGVDNMLTIIGDGRKAAIDMRLVKRANTGVSKLQMVIDSTAKIWHESRGNVYSGKDGKPDEIKGSVQLIFSDIRYAYEDTDRVDAKGKPVRIAYFDLYQNIKDELVKQGVPADQIVFIQDYTNSLKKKRLFKEVNDGRKTIIIGGSDNLGTGVNVQKRLIAMHNLDINYVPAKMEQRRGRGERQGNQNEQVQDKLYVTKGTTDASMLQLNENKTRMVDQVLRGDFSVHAVADLNTAADDIAQAKAIASGNPLLMEQAGVLNEVKRLQALRDAHMNKLATFRSSLREANTMQEIHERRLPISEGIAKQVTDTKGDLFTATLGENTFDKRPDYGAAVVQQMEAILTSKDPRPRVLGKIAGLDMYGYFKDGQVNLSFSRDYTDFKERIERIGQTETLSAIGLVAKMENTARGLRDEPAKIREGIEKAKADVERYQKALTQKFEYASQLEEQQAKLDDINRQLEEGLSNDETVTEAEPDADESATLQSRTVKNTDIPKDTLKGFRSAREAADWLANNAQEPAFRKLAQQIRDLLGDTTIAVHDKSKPREGHVHGEYRFRTVNGRNLLDVIDLYPTGHNESSLIHELIHAATTRTINKPKTAAQKAAVANLKEVVNVFKKGTAQFTKDLTPDERIAVDNATDLFNALDEFVAYTLTSPDFQSALKKMKIEGQSDSLFTKLAKALKKLLGVTVSDGYFQTAMDAATNLVESVSQNATGDIDVTLSHKSGKDTRNQSEPEAAREVARAIWKGEGDARQRFVDNSKGNLRKLKGVALGAFSGRQLAELYGPLFQKFSDAKILRKNPIITIADLMQNMQALRNKWVNTAEKIDQRWARLARSNKPQYKTVARVMYESTIAGIDPREPYTPLFQNPKTQKNIDKQLKHREDYDRIMTYWNSLDSTTKQLYSDVEQHYRNQYQAMIQALKDRADGLFGPRGVDIAKMIDQRMGTIKGPYFPLMRFGPYFIKATDPDGNDYREHFEKEGEMLAARKELEAAGFTIESNGQIKAYQDMRSASGESGGIMPFVKQVENRILKEDSPYTTREKLKFLDELNQTALTLLPDTSYAKRSLHRRNVAGYDSNARRAFNATALAGANRLARVTYGWQVDETIDAMRQATDNNAQTGTLTDTENITAQNVIDELHKRQALNMNPQTSPWSSFAVNFAFFNYLGASIGAGLVNLTQTPLLALPILGSRYGYRRTSRYMAKAAADYFGKGKRGFEDATDFLNNAWFTLEDNAALPEDERKFLQQLIDDGTIETTQASTMAGNAGVDLDQAQQANRDWYNNLVKGSGLFFHNAEVANRQVTALTAYRLWRDDFQKKKGRHYTLTPADIQKGAAFARKATFDAHFDYSNYNRPRYMKGNWGRVFLIFKQYSQNMTYLLGKTFWDATRGLDKDTKRIARRQLAGILGLSTLASGVMGLPGLFLLKWFAEAIGGDDDEPFDADVEFRKWITPFVGKDIAHALAKGVFNGFAGLDLHARVKLSDLWFQDDNRDLSARDEGLNMLLTAAGPFFSQLLSMGVGLNEIASGDGWKGMERILPKMIRDPMKAIRYSQDGMVDSYGNVMVEDFSLYNELWKSIGISAASESEAWDARNAVKGMQAKLGSRRQTLLNDYYTAQSENDQGYLQDVKDQIKGFNAARQRDDLTAMLITPKTLRQSLKARASRQKKTEKGIYLPTTQIGLRDYATGYAY